MFLFIYSTIIKTFFCSRNIWDASLVVERVFKSGNKEITAVSVLYNSIPSSLCNQFIFSVDK